MQLNPTVVAALRPLPRLHGLRDGVPVRRPVRPADRADPRRRSSGSTDRSRGERAAALADLPRLPVPSPACARRCALAAAGAQASRCPGSLEPLARRWRRRGARPSGRPAVTSRAASVSRPRRASSTGCVQRVVFGDVNAATARVLAADGFEVVAPRRQALLRRARRARRPARGGPGARPAADRRRSSRPASTSIVTNAAGCGSNLKDYGTLLADDPRYAERAAAFSAEVRDVSEILAEPDPRAERQPLPLARRVPGLLPSPPRAGRARARRARCWRAVPGLERRRACRAGALLRQCRDLQPRAAARRPRELGRAQGERTCSRPSADAYASANPGCLVQVTAHLRRARAARCLRSTRSSSSTRRSAACRSSSSWRARALAGT